MLYCSCLSRQSWARASPFPGKSSSPRAVTENTSNRVPYASNAIAFIAPPLSCRSLSRPGPRPPGSRLPLHERGQDDRDHVLEHRPLWTGLGHDRKALGAACEETGEGPQVSGGGQLALCARTLERAEKGRLERGQRAA